MGDCLISLVGDGFVIFAADTAQARSILLMKPDEDKVMALDKFKLLAASGAQGDKVQFCEYIQKNIKLYELRTGVALSTHAAATYTRGELATALRRAPYETNLLLGGYDPSEGASLYFIDYLANFHKTDFACQGYAGYFLLGLLDKYYRKGMSVDDAVDVLRKCVDQLKIRFVLNTVSFTVKIVDSTGSRTLESLR